MKIIFDKVDAQDPSFYEEGETVVTTCRLVTRSRTSGETLDSPMVQMVRVRGERIVEFRPFYWNVPAYCETVRSVR